MKFFSILFVILSVLFSATARAEYSVSEVSKAIVEKESKGNLFAVGDKLDRHGKPRPPSEWAYGYRQIRQPCVDDVNRKFGTYYKAKECLGNKELSDWIYERYMDIYATEKFLGRKPTAEDRARIWNGGPSGYKSRATIAYWCDIQKILRRLAES